MIFLRQKKGQAVFGEYVLLAVIVVAAVTAMTVYVRRALQGRVRDAVMSSAATVRTPFSMDGGTTFEPYRGPIHLQYEPYYANRASFIDQQSDGVRTLTAGGSSGIFREDINERTYIQSYSNQGPPKDAR